MTKEKRFQLRQSAILLLTALIWGVAFVAQSIGMEYIGPFTLVGIRFLLGALTLLPAMCLQGRRRLTEGGRSPLAGNESGAGRRRLIAGGILCGIALGSASALQQVGIAHTTVGKAAFLTTLYIVLVPLFALFRGKRVKAVIWLCVAIALAGVYFLSMPKGSFRLMTGDALCLSCAVVFAIQITLVDHYTNLVDGIRLAFLQFVTASVLGFALMLLFEHPSLSDIWQAAGPLLYLGVLSTGTAYTLQIIGQRGLNPTIASLIMSLESTISAIAGYVFLHQTLTARELAGCILMGLAIVITQLV